MINKWKKGLCLNFAVMMMIVFSTVFLCSCINLYKETNKGVSPEAQKVLESVIEENGGVEPDMRYSTGEVSFNIHLGWKKVQDSECFWDRERTNVYGLNASSPLGSIAPEECFSFLVEYYQEEDYFKLLDQSESLTQWYSEEKVLCYLGTITGEMEGGYTYTEVVIAPQKNLVLTFVGQTSYIDIDKDTESTIKRNVTELRESLMFEMGNADYVSGNTYLYDDGSELCLHEDGTFAYYEKEEEHEKQYLAGTYETFYGQPAFDQVASMTEYGLEKEELEQMLSANMNGYIPEGSRPIDYMYATSPEMTDTRPRYQICKDTFYAVVFHNMIYANTEGEQEEIEKDSLYIGFYIPELNIMDMTNCNAAAHATWTYKGKTE
ncbi:hypothetical protein [Lacrimispora sp.]|uniref:hypothetical protein n=1 Tax=Lacrimispora sp. TaxID=2719234 RepID=UPI0028B2666F|nr:hypothetical protein [Lacrimispora sp.]